VTEGGAQSVFQRSDQVVKKFVFLLGGLLADFPDMQDWLLKEIFFVSRMNRLDADAVFNNIEFGITC
jgi:hypothetical protein